MKPSSVRRSGRSTNCSVPSVKENTTKSSQSSNKQERRQDEDKSGLPTKKAKLVHSTNIGSKKLTCELEFDSEKVPENGSTEMYSAIFKAAKFCGTTTDEDLKKIDDDVRKFWGKPIGLETKSKTGKKKPAETFTSALHVEEPETETELSDTEELLRQCNRLLDDDGKTKVAAHNDSGFISSTSATTSTSELVPYRTSNRMDSRSSTRERKTKKSKKKKVIDVICLSSDEDDFTPPAETPPYLQDLIFFSVVYFNKRYPMHFRRTDKVRLIRENLAKVTKLIPEGFEMYLGEDVKLEDEDTLESVKMTENCEIDAFYNEKPLKELYQDGAISILRFKLQTSDRTGRQTMHVYVQKESTMMCALQQYADHFAIDARKITLRFDGDPILLDRNPESNELEGEECIDVIISE